jgi:hypothetical protein
MGATNRAGTTYPSGAINGVVFVVFHFITGYEIST